MKKAFLHYTAVLLLSTALLLPGAARAEVKTETGVVWYRVHFGMGVGSASMTPEVLTAFMDKEVSSRFPEGLTVTVSRGQWRSPHGGVIKEKTMVVDIQCPDTEDNRNNIKAMAKAYLSRFGKLKASVFVMRIPGIDTQLWY